MIAAEDAPEKSAPVGGEREVGGHDLAWLVTERLHGEPLTHGMDSDGVLALYHDQAFIPVKLLSDDGGVTVLAGLPYLRVSPVHGTAFDIAGRGVASAENLIQALLRAAAWVRERSDSA